MSRRSIVFALFALHGLAGRSPAQTDIKILPEPTAAEAAIHAALDQQVTLTFEETPLNEALETIGRMTELPWQIDNKALEDAGVTSDTPITWRIRDVSLRSALGMILGELELTWLIQHEVLLVTTAEEANSTLLTLYYHVDSLNVRASGQARRDHLADLIEQLVEPESWDDVGGPGAAEAITVNGRRWLMVSQTRDVHEQVIDVLRMLATAGGRRMLAGSATTEKRRQRRPASAAQVAPADATPRLIWEATSGGAPWTMAGAGQ